MNDLPAYGAIPLETVEDLLFPDPAEAHWAGNIYSRPGLFWTPATLTPGTELPPDGTGIGLKVVESLSMVWGESDTGTITEQLQRLDTAIAAGMPEPTVVALSGDPRPEGAVAGKSVHMFWRTTDAPWEPQSDEWRTVMAGIVHSIDGDTAVIDPARRMRVPGVEDGGRHQTVIRTGPQTTRVALAAWSATVVLPAALKAKARWRPPARVHIDFGTVDLSDGSTLADAAAALEEAGHKITVDCPFHASVGGRAMFVSRNTSERAYAYCSACDKTWVDLPSDTLTLDRTAKGLPLKTMTNVARILRGDSMFAGRLSYNERSLNVCLDGESLEDAALILMREQISDAHSYEPTATAMADAVNLVAWQNSRNPLTAYLGSLEWDGTPRLSSWLVKAAKVEDTELHRAYGRKFLIAAVARAMDPGCKVDNVLLLVGVPRLRKSSMFAALFGSDWFGDSDLDLSNKDSAMVLARSWCHEISELSSFSRADAARVKSFISRQVDMFRPPYGRSVVDHKRHTVVVATSNDRTPLKDQSGNRRFWAVEVDGLADLPWVTKNRDQLWAEAVTAYNAGEPWWLDQRMEDKADDSNEQYLVANPQETAVLQWLEKHSKNEVRVVDILVHALHVPLGDTQRHAGSIGNILRGAGWTHKRTANGRVWARPVKP